MALMKKCCEVKSKGGAAVNAAEEGLGLGFVRYTRGLGRKRIVISNIVEESPIKTPLKRQRSGLMVSGCEKSVLESLPQDILIRILCGVDHEDLERLFHVSKSIREAALIAKQCHFAYSTPKKTLVFRTSIDFDESGDFDEMEPPNAPKFKRHNKSRTGGKDISSISMVLFA